LPAAQQIADGHAWGRHKKEFPGWDKQTFTEKDDETIKNATGGDLKQLSGGRSAYWNDKERMVVIRNPRSPDGGAAFRPKNDKTYFNNPK
jgi:filamentous hemagglutinin